MPKNGMLRVAGVANRLDFPFDSAHAEAAGNENSVHAAEDRVGPAPLTSSASTRWTITRGTIGDAGMIE